MTADSRSTAKLRQIAVLGSSADIVTDSELALAERAGKRIAERQFVLATAGDDGVMGAAAKASKFAGGRTVAILPRGKGLESGWLFDVVIDTGLSWIQFSDVLLRSCRGALIIGGGAGTLGELALLYLNAIPGAFVGSESALAKTFGGQHLDSRKLSVFPCFDDVDNALDHLINASIGWSDGADVALQRGREIHATCYPFGIEGDYLASAFYYSMAAGQTTGSSPSWADGASLCHDALGDHEYYHTRDFFRAAGHYSRALELATQRLRILDGTEKTEAQSFVEYLRSMAIESAALAFDSLGEPSLAAYLCGEASGRYEAAISTAPPQEHSYLRHSSLGLQAFASYLEADAAFKDHRLQDAKALIERAKALCDASLQAQPLWRESGFSDSYSEFSDRIDALQAAIASDTGGPRNASSDS